MLIACFAVFRQFREAYVPRSARWLLAGILRGESLFGFLIVIAAMAPPATAQLPTPQLRWTWPLGAQAGSTIELELGGSDLDEVEYLEFSDASILWECVTREAELGESEPQRVPNRFRVMFPPQLESGLYEVRAVGRFGISNPRLISVSSLPEKTEPGDNHGSENACELRVGEVCNGRTDAGQFDWYAVRLQAGQRVTVSCESTSLDTAARCVIALFDPDGVEIGRSLQLASVRQILEAEDDGIYRISVQDHTFSGGNEFGYRLGVYRGIRPDQLYPPVIGSIEQVRDMVGISNTWVRGGAKRHGWGRWSVPDEASWDQWLEAERPSSGRGPDDESTVFAERPLVASSLITADRWRVNNPEWGGPLVVWAADTQLPITSERLDQFDDPLDLPSGDNETVVVPAPCIVAGRWFPHGDVDWWETELKGGQDWVVEVFSHRLGLPTDARLAIQRFQPDQEADTGTWKTVEILDQVRLGGDNNVRRPVDPNSRDPRAMFRVPETGRYRIGVRDLYAGSRDDPTLAYWIEIRAPRPDFRLVAWVAAPHPANGGQYELQSAVLRRGETCAVDVVVDRVDGWAGAVDLQVEGLPEGLQAAPVRIESAVYQARLFITATRDASLWHGRVDIIGSAVGPGSLDLEPAETELEDRVEPVRHPASIATMVESTGDVNNHQPATRLTDRLWLAVLDVEQMPVTLTPPRELETSIGAKLTVPVEVVRSDGFEKALELNSAKLPDGIKVETLKIAEKASSAETSLQITDSGFTASEIEFCFEGSTSFSYPRNAQAVERARAAKERVEQQLAELKSRVEQADEQQLPALQEQLKQVEARVQQLQQQLESVQKQNEPKDLPVRILSSPVRLRVHKLPLTLTAEVVASGTDTPATAEGLRTFPVQLNVQRRFGFDGPVRLELVEGDEQKWRGEPIELPADATQQNWELARPADADKPGPIVAKVTVRFNDIECNEQQIIRLQGSE